MINYNPFRDLTPEENNLYTYDAVAHKTLRLLQDGLDPLTIITHLLQTLRERDRVILEVSLSIPSLILPKLPDSTYNPNALFILGFIKNYPAHEFFLYPYSETNHTLKSSYGDIFQTDPAVREGTTFEQWYRFWFEHYQTLRP